MDYLAYQKCLSNIGVFFFIQTLDWFPAYLFIHIFVYIYIFVYILFLYICISIHFCLYISCLPLYLFTYINIFVTWSKYFLSSPSLCCTKRPREVSEWSFLKLHSKKWFFLFIYLIIFLSLKQLVQKAFRHSKDDIILKIDANLTKLWCGEYFCIPWSNSISAPPPAPHTGSREDNKWKQIYCSIVSLYPLVLHPPCYVTRTN